MLVALAIVILLVGLVDLAANRVSPPAVELPSRTSALNSLWTAESNLDGARFGNCVANAGDTDGDGYDDILVGAPYYSDDQTNEGRAYLYRGSSSGLAASPSWTVDGDQDSVNLGLSLATAGDVNGDGYDDVIVGVPVWTNGSTGEGRACVYMGSSAGLAATPSWFAEGNQNGARFGYSVASAGDVNGDGCDDVIVGAYAYDNVFTDVGRAFLYLGSSSGLSESPSWTAGTNQALAYFGYCVSSAGDVNNDGFDDVVVGAHTFSNDTSGEGRAYVFLGSSSGLSVSPSWIAEGNQQLSFFGYSVSSAGDVNGDLFDDVIVGSQSYGDYDEGRAYIYFGSSSGPSKTPSWIAESAWNWSRFGRSVASAGDVNNDGYDDVIVGTDYYSNVETNEGAAFLYLGSGSGPPSSPSWSVESDLAEARFGRSVSSAGDVNGDGADEVLVGAWGFANGETDEGRAYLFGWVTIPEFDVLLVPIVGVVAVFVVLRRTEAGRPD